MLYTKNYSKKSVCMMNVDIGFLVKPMLLAIDATDHLKHPQHQFLLPCHLHDHLLYFLQMINVYDTLLNFLLESYQTLST